MKILAFDLDYYFKDRGQYLESREKENFLNIVPLDDMSEKERLETAMGDDCHVSLWEDVDSFLQDLNNGFPDFPSAFYKCAD